MKADPRWRSGGRSGLGALPSQGVGGRPGRSRRIVLLGVAAALFAAIFVLRLATDAADGLTAFLYAIPVALAVAVLYSGVHEARRIQRQLIESAPDAIVGIGEDRKIVVVNAQAERLFGYERQELIGQGIETLLPTSLDSEDPGYIAGFFERPEQRPLNFAVGLRGRHWLGHEFPCEISLSALEVGRETIALASIRDVTERTRADEELRRAFRRLEATTEIARAIGGETELETVLDAIVERGRALVEAKGLIVMLVEGDGLIVAATAGNVEAGIRGMRVPLSGLTAAAVKTLQPQRVDEMGGMPGMPSAEDRPNAGASAAIVVPLEFRGAALGVVAAFDRRDGPAFSEEDERLLIAFAASAATAVATARDVAQDRLRRTIEGAEQERKRWARELHDETLQGLGALRVALASALRGGSAEGLREVVATAVDEIAEEIRSLRSLISELRPAALDELGLAAALEALSERSASLVGLEMQTRVDVGTAQGDDVGRLSPELESTIYRLVQEALSNVAKHSRAERVEVAVTERSGYVDVLVRDDGVGFDPGSAGGGFGLLGMRERVAMAGGRFEISSKPGEGASVKARIPIGAPDVGTEGLSLEKAPLERVANEL